MKFCWLLLSCCYTEKSFWSPNPSLFHKWEPLEKYLSWQPCSHMISLTWSPWISLVAFRPAMSKLSLLRGHRRLYIFCCFFEDLLGHLTGLIYPCPHLDLKNKIIRKTKTGKQKEERKKKYHSRFCYQVISTVYSMGCVCIYFNTVKMIL